jgi:hypothetical protein
MPLRTMVCTTNLDRNVARANNELVISNDDDPCSFTTKDIVGPGASSGIQIQDRHQTLRDLLDSIVQEFLTDEPRRKSGPTYERAQKPNNVFQSSQ